MTMEVQRCRSARGASTQPKSRKQSYNAAPTRRPEAYHSLRPVRSAFDADLPPIADPPMQSVPSQDEAAARSQMHLKLNRATRCYEVVLLSCFRIKEPHATADHSQPRCFIGSRSTLRQVTATTVASHMAIATNHVFADIVVGVLAIIGLNRFGVWRRREATLG